jgi:hypothetical protein
MQESQSIASLVRFVQFAEVTRRPSSFGQSSIVDAQVVCSFQIDKNANVKTSATYEQSNEVLRRKRGLKRFSLALPRNFKSDTILGLEANLPRAASRTESRSPA